MSKEKKLDISIENTFLPVGSVVMLKGATTPLIIIGFAVVEKKKIKFGIIWELFIQLVI